MAEGTRVAGAFVELGIDASGLGAAVRSAVSDALRGVRGQVPLVAGTGLRTEVSRAIDRATSGQRAEVPVEPDATAFTPRLNAAIADAVGRVRARVGTEPDTAGYRIALAAEVAREAAAVQAEVGTTVDAGQLRSEISRAVKAAAVGQQAEVEVTADAGGLRGAVSRAAAAAGFGQRISIPVRVDTASLVDLSILSTTITSALKIPALIAGVNQLAGVVAALGGAAVAVGSAIAPVVGLAGTLPSIFGALGQGAGTVALATAGVGDALDAIAEAREKSRAGGTEATEAAKELRVKLAALPAGVGNFALALDALRPKLTQLRATAAAGVLPGFADALKDVATLAPEVNQVVGRTAEVIGSLARRGAELVTSPAWRTDIAAFGASNARILESLGDAGLSMIDALRGITLAAAPVAERIAEGIGRFAENLARAVQEGRNSGELADFFERAADVGGQLLRILGNLGGVLLNVGRAAAPLGQSLLDSFEQATAGLERLTASVEGQTALRDFFDDLRPVLREVGALIGDVLSAIGSFATNPSTASTIALLREQLLPALVELGQSASGVFGEKLIGLATTFIELFSRLATETGSLMVFVEVLTQMGQVAITLFDAVPGFAEFVFLFTTLKSALLVISAFKVPAGLLALAGLGGAAAGGAAAGGAVTGIGAAAGAAAGGGFLAKFALALRGGLPGIAAALGPAGRLAGAAIGVAIGTGAAGELFEGITRGITSRSGQSGGEVSIFDFLRPGARGSGEGKRKFLAEMQEQIDDLAESVGKESIKAFQAVQLDVGNIFVPTGFDKLRVMSAQVGNILSEIQPVDLGRIGTSTVESVAAGGRKAIPLVEVMALTTGNILRSIPPADGTLVGARTVESVAAGATQRLGAVQGTIVQVGNILSSIQPVDRSEAGANTVQSITLAFTDRLGGLSTAVAQVGNILSSPTPANLSGVGSATIDSMRAGAQGALPGITSIFASLGGIAAGAVKTVSIAPEGAAAAQSFINGVESKFAAIRRVAADVGNIFKANKGPIDKDRVLLFPEGQAIMEGLLAGVASQVPALRALLGDVTGIVAGTSPRLSLLPAGGIPRLPTAPNVGGVGSPGALPPGTTVTQNVNVTLAQERDTPDAVARSLRVQGFLAGL